MGDRVAVMSKGVLQQVDMPQRLYDRPANLFVAGFIGTPPMNLLEGTVSVNGGVSVDIGGNAIAVADEALAATRGSGAATATGSSSAFAPATSIRRRGEPTCRRSTPRPARRVARRRVDGVLQGRRAPAAGEAADEEEVLESEGGRDRRRSPAEPRRLVPAACRAELG